MKAYFAILAVLAASASASPMRIITITSDSDFLPVENVEISQAIPIRYDSHYGDAVSSSTGNSDRSGKPCHGQRQASGSISVGATPVGPFGALLSRIGLSSAPPVHHSAVQSLDSAPARDATRISLLDEWRHHVEDLIHDAHQKVAPVLEGGVVRFSPIMRHDPSPAEDELNDVRWWRFTSGNAWQVKDGEGSWREPRKNEKPPMGRLAVADDATQQDGHPFAQSQRHVVQAQVPAQAQIQHSAHHAHRHRHGHHPSSLAGRIHRAIRSLRPAESFSLAFVIGAGIGSIIHCIFMLALIGFRRIRCDTEETRARRAARRGARRARKEARKMGAIRLEGDENVRGNRSPSFEAAEERLVEKA